MPLAQDRRRHEAEPTGRLVEEYLMHRGHEARARTGAARVREARREVAVAAVLYDRPGGLERLEAALRVRVFGGT